MYKDNSAAEKREEDEARAAAYFSSTAVSISDLINVNAALRVNAVN